MGKKRFILGLLLPLLLLSSCVAVPEAAPAEGTVPPTLPATPEQTVIETVPTETPVPETVLAPVSLTTTVLWIDGIKYPACYEAEGEKYVRLGDLRELAGETLWGHTLTVEGEQVFIDGEETTCPCYAWNGEQYLATASLLPALGLTELVDESWNQRFYTRIPKSDQIPTGYGVPILMYHAVSDNVWGIAELFVSPADMEAQLKAMLDAGCTPITFEDLDRIDQIQKPVMLTFDDGYRDNYTELFPLLQKYQVKVTIFLITDCFDKEKNLTREQIVEMQNSGLVSFQSHTKTHEDLDEMDEARLITECQESMMAITRLTGRQPFVLCYPEGRANALAKEVAARYYQYGLYMGGSKYVTGGAPFDIYRQYISRYTDLSKFLSYVN